ncbi:MAG TPA: 50S ribosomal protein L29 [Terriglobales bacterium]|nr:50S ribosomal protein L29 [Terriglobales bacterium]
MLIEKIRNLGPDELRQQERDSAEQVFRLKFQLRMGQTTGLKKMRELRKDLARMKTIARERELGISDVAAGDTLSDTSASAESAQEQAKEPKRAQSAKPAAKAAKTKKKASAAKKSSAKSAGKKKAPAAKAKKKKAAKK